MSGPLTFAIVGGDVRCSALARALVREGHRAAIIPGPPDRPLWQAMRETGAIVDAVRRAAPDVVVCLHVESSEAGVVDALRAALPEMLVFGVDAAAARLETSKLYGLRVAEAAGLHVPASVHVPAGTRADWLREHVPAGPRVVKYDGLWGGRGTIVAPDEPALRAAFESLPPGDLVVQEYVHGFEVALSLLCTGAGIALLDVNFEYKRELDGDRGGNTPGMGTVARAAAGLPLPCFAQGLPEQLHRIGYRGPLDVSFMVDPDAGRAVFLEFTARFGDPELCSELLLIDDVSGLLLSVARNAPIVLRRTAAEWAVALVAVGGILRGTPPAPVALESMTGDAGLWSVLAAAGAELQDVRHVLYSAAGSVLDGARYRKDIGHDAEARLAAFQTVAPALLTLP